MEDLKKLGRNIRCLRRAFGETQSDLAKVIHVEVNTISQYENGKRRPEKETLDEIASYYGVLVENLFKSDLSKIEAVNTDVTSFWKNIDRIFPIIANDKAMNNDSFRTAFKNHKKFYDELKEMNMDEIDGIEDCYEDYEKAVEDPNAKAEASANIVSLICIFAVLIKNYSFWLNNDTAAYNQVIRNNPDYRKMFDSAKKKSTDDEDEILKELYDEDLQNKIIECLKALKESEYSDLTYYYLAIQYVWNLQDNDMSKELNYHVGINMMYSLSSIGNKYANDYVNFYIENIRISE